MGWKQAFLAQARSDQAILERLNLPAVEYSHRLHYLQMVTEKLSKAMLSSSAGSGNPPPITHSAFVKMLRNLKGRPDIRRRLGFSDTASFNSYIHSLLELAEKIEQLAPTFAGINLPNPEYPWRDVKNGDVIAPSDYAFPEFKPSDPKLQKIMVLVRALLRIEA